MSPDPETFDEDHEEIIRLFLHYVEVDPYPITGGSMPRIERGCKSEFTKNMEKVEQGDAEAQFALGYTYYHGEGVDKDYEKAFEWIMKAAKQWNAIAQRRVGLSYQAGAGVDKNLKEAMKWFKFAADQGDADAQKSLDEMLKEQSLSDLLKKSQKKWETEGVFIKANLKKEYSEYLSDDKRKNYDEGLIP